MSDLHLPLSGRAALVTGAGRGLGQAHAIALAERGAMVAVNSRQQQSVDAVVSEIRANGGVAFACAGDLEAEGVASQVVDQAVAAMGGLDIVVNNAGGDAVAPAAFPDIGRTDRNAMMRNNFETSWDVTSAAWQHLQLSGSGRLVLTSSPLAFYGQNGLAHYAAAKGAVVGMARTLTVEGRPHGINVNVVNPIANTAGRKAFERWSATTFPAGHVATAVTWLVDEGCTVTGQIISIGGTRVARVSITENTGWIGDAELLDPEQLRGREDEVLNAGSSVEFTEMNELLAFLDGVYGDRESATTP